ncbi:hypothetical protein ACIO14_25500 [Nocardia fluminea]|uniref:hypothetical protein n=1 Tax=Nocardia fluminea TaxID=134984 RepID=UPI0038044543
MVRDHTDNNAADVDEQTEDVNAEHLRPRPPLPFLRALNPHRRYRRWKTLRSIRFEAFGPPITAGAATDFRSITLYHRDRDDWPVGKVSYLICHPCRRAFIGNLDVNPSLQGHGIATRVLADIRKQIPGYTWLTSRHMPTAKSFWLLIAERTGEAYADTEPDHTCEHMAPFWRGGATWANTKRLDRSVGTE